MGGAGELIGGAVLGTLFSELYERLEKLIIKNFKYKKILNDFKSSLDSLKPVIDQIEEYNRELDHPEQELKDLKEVMEKGIELVGKCFEVRKWQFYEKNKYANKLVELDKSLQALLRRLHVQSIRDVKENSVSARSMKKDLSRIEPMLSRIESSLVLQNQAKTEAWCAAPELPLLVVGLDFPLKELKRKLLNLKDGVSMLVLTAPGGCGKTTLATTFCQDQEVKDIFRDNIFFVTVSKNPNLEYIVKWLHHFLKEQGQNPLLLVLDDVWSGSESLLEKFDQFKMPNYKLLVTSRSEFRRFGSSYRLQSLDYDNAMKLFHHYASLGDKSSHIPEDLSRQIVEHCKGFPLAIKVHGGSLCGQPIEIWTQRLIEWSRGSTVHDSGDELLLCLQSSFEALDKEIKKCFLDLGLFPEDQRIPAAALIDIWTEYYDLDEDAECIANLYRLSDRSLANLVVIRKEKVEKVEKVEKEEKKEKVEKKEGNQYYSEHFVTQHDILRELAIYYSKQEPVEQRTRLIFDIRGNNKLPSWWREQKHQVMKARLLSISTTDRLFPKELHNMQVPDVEVLVLNFQTNNYALPESVENMDKLKALIVTNSGFLPAELSNFQLLSSLSNLKRIRLERISILSITKNPIELKSLQKISLFMCNIGQAFSNCSIPISSAFPNLEEINIDYCDDLVELPADLCDLIQLKKLSVTNCHKLSALPEEIGKLVNLEVLRLRCCTDLVKLPGSIEYLTRLHFLDIYKCFSIKELPEKIGELSGLETINMGQCSRLQELPVSVLNLGKLQEVICDEETEILWGEMFKSRLTRISVVKEDFNLHWLHKF
ncbi:PREDICTED: probable disease resistance protein At5g66900 isoform X2 [Prunus mume]|uniref:Probable disease resistance protein At5g66900 isoform X2 n=1 Tax=Prunus mume TaxID=102107 RepID=A0ABM0PM17_PRUMU|nr:PREDICTED: probable disease resistance protein At5g66900 isoform X2 [Prunus mume]